MSETFSALTLDEAAPGARDSSFYDTEWADQWQDMKAYSPVARHTRRLILRALDRIPHDSLIDIGCGIGSLLQGLVDLDRPVRYAGVDFSEKAVRIAAGRLNAQFTRLDVESEWLDETFDIGVCSEVLEHLEDALVGAAVERSPERADACRNRGVDVGVRGADHTHGRRRAVLLVIRVKDKQCVDRLLDSGVDGVIVAGASVHHLEEVASVAQAAGGVDDGLSLGVTVEGSGDRLELGDERARGSVRSRARRGRRGPVREVSEGHRRKSAPCFGDGELGGGASRRRKTRCP